MAVLLLALPGALHAAVAADSHVVLNGKDANSGTETKPFATLATAGAAPRFAFDCDQHQFTFADGLVGLENARLSLEANGQRLRANQAKGTWQPAHHGGTSELTFDAPGLVWNLTFERTGKTVLQLASTLRNTSAQSIRLGRVRLADGPLRLGGGDPGQAVLLTMSGWQGSSRLRKFPVGGEPLSSRILAPVHHEGASVLLAFKTFDRAWTEHQVTARTAVSTCDFAGYALAPGASIAVETLWIDLGADPFTSLERWADAVQAHYRPVTWPKIPGGWVGWSWVDGFNVERYEDVVLRNAKAVRQRLPEQDIEFLWVSLGNLEGRRPGNWLRWNRTLFPSGPEELVRQLGALDFKLGLWVGAFWLNTELAADFERLHDAVLTYQGKPITISSGQWGTSYAPDPTHPKTQAMLREVFTTYRQWGVRYYMIDFLNAISGEVPGQHRNDGYYDKTLIAGPQAYREGLRVIREAAGSDTYLLSSTGPTFHNIGYINATRVGSDYGEGRPLDGPGQGFFPGTFVVNRADYWTSHMRATEAMASHYFAHNKLFISDSGNVLTVDKPIPLPDAQISATLFGINGGPVMLGDDIDRISEERLDLIRKVFPRLAECARPLDLFEAAEPDSPKLFHLKVRTAWDTWDVLAVFNYGNEIARHRVPLAKMGLDPASGYLVWDFWNERPLGRQTGSLDIEVAPKSVKVLRLSRERLHPWVMSTDMHVRQGQAEILDCRWDAAARTLTLRASRAGRHPGNVFVRAPAGMSVANPQGLWLAKDGSDQALLIRVAFSFSQVAEEKTIRFNPGASKSGEP